MYHLLPIPAFLFCREIVTRTRMLTTSWLRKMLSVSIKLVRGDWGQMNLALTWFLPREAFLSWKLPWMPILGYELFFWRLGFCFKGYKYFNSYTFCLQMANRDLLSSVGREFSGNVESGLKTICKILSCFALFCL